jgi:threonine/homoserine/homoserine lactone efflux protein
LAVFAAAVTGLMLIPGPNVALITANSMAHGKRFGFVTVAGTASAMAVQLGVTALGLTALLGAAGAVFTWVRLAGAAYLIWLAIQTWRAPPTSTVQPVAPNAMAVFSRGLLVSLTNPKTLVFYAAFLPQFIRPEGSLAAQMAILAALFLAIALTVDTGWVFAAHLARTQLARHAQVRQRVTALLLGGTGLGILLLRDR